MKALSYRQWLANQNQGRSHPAGLPLSLVRIDNLEYLSTLVIADFSQFLIIERSSKCYHSTTKQTFALNAYAFPSNIIILMMLKPSSKKHESFLILFLAQATQKLSAPIVSWQKKLRINVVFFFAQQQTWALDSHHTFCKSWQYILLVKPFWVATRHKAKKLICYFFFCYWRVCGWYSQFTHKTISIDVGGTTSMVPHGLAFSKKFCHADKILGWLFFHQLSLFAFFQNFQIKNRAGLVLTHQCNPVSLFSNLGQNAKHYLSNWLKTFLHLGLSTSLLPCVEPSLVFNFSKGVFQDVGNFVQKSGKKCTKQEQNNKKGGADERY